MSRVSQRLARGHLHCALPEHWNQSDAVRARHNGAFDVRKTVSAAGMTESRLSEESGSITTPSRCGRAGTAVHHAPRWIWTGTCSIRLMCLARRRQPGRLPTAFHSRFHPGVEVDSTAQSVPDSGNSDHLLGSGSLQEFVPDQRSRRSVATQCPDAEHEPTASEQASTSFV